MKRAGPESHHFMGNGTMKRYGIWGAVLATTLVAAACDDEPEMMAPVTEQMFEVRVENVSTVYDFTATGVFNTPAGEAGPGPLFPGGVYEATFDAAPGTHLSFATMFVQSNDLFYAPAGAGIEADDSDSAVEVGRSAGGGVGDPFVDEHVSVDGPGRFEPARVSDAYGKFPSPLQEME